MDKRKLKFLSLILIILALSGCATAKGLGEGIGKISQGLIQDSKNFWQALLKADNWIKENLW
jgi:predicted small secreted protein